MNEPGTQQTSTRARARVLLVLVPALIVLIIVAIVAVLGDVDMGWLFRDPAQLFDFHPLAGTVSSLGIILWWFAASICLFTFALSHRLGLSRAMRIFLLSSALLTVLLAIDDQFLIHDDLASRVLGLRERHVIVGYLVLVSLYALLNLAVIRRSEWTLLVAALGLFAGSIGADFVTQSLLGESEALGVGLDWGLFIEDGFKFLGIAAWVAYLVRFSYRAILDASQPRGPEIEHA